MIIRPQPGKQEEFIKSNADIVLYGGSAGSGKTFAILMDVLRYINRDGFNAIYFRQSLKEIKMPGGLWSESYRLYSYFNASANISDLMWNFYNSNKKVVSTLTFKQIENDASVYSFQGSQICGMYFDELTHFTWHQFNYLMSRNRAHAVSSRTFVLLATRKRIIG
jgi:glycyl-tRNA synthetase alpha subunit